MSRQPEGKLTESIIAYLRGRRAFVFKVHGSEFQEPGIPDLICCWHGLFIGLEVKLPGEKPSKRQSYIMDKIEDAEGHARVVRSIDDVEHLLRRIERKRG